MAPFDDEVTDHEILFVVADDLPRRAFERALTDHGHQPVFATGHAEALALAKERAFRLCVIDLLGSSLSSATQMAEDLAETNDAMHVIIIHGSHANEQAGDFQLLRRPFSMFEFISTIDHALSVGF